MTIILIWTNMGLKTSLSITRNLKKYYVFFWSVGVKIKQARTATDDIKLVNNMTHTCCVELRQKLIPTTTCS